jgi:hypothetical protein
MRKALSLIALVVAGFTLAAAPDAARAETLVERFTAKPQRVCAVDVFGRHHDDLRGHRCRRDRGVSHFLLGRGAVPAGHGRSKRQCDGRVPVLGLWKTSQFALQVKGNLSSAHLSAALDLQDSVSGAIEPFTVKLTFTGVGEVFEEKNHFTSNEGGMIVNVFFDGLQRDASATGTVSGLGNNFTPVPAAVAFIQKLHSGTVLVTKE